MRLLKRDDAGGVSFTEDLPESELPAYKYAILSHTWGKNDEEVIYNDIISGTGSSKPGIGSAKIKFCLQQTRQDDLNYFWIDTCCIDKNNLVELDRSLRSMFRWYSNAEKCYVFLSDVPQTDQSNELGADWEQHFRFSRWFKRGWTLQELIAPTTVEFYSKHGTRLGTKASLERQINEITHIPVAALRGRALTDFTVEERRQWQEGRETREPEDLVYSLLGLFDVSMPVLYGEGRLKAWERLDNALTIARKGIQHQDFSLVFSLAGAAVETPNFIARNSELQQMREHLRSDGSRKFVVLHGLGDIERNLDGAIDGVLAWLSSRMNIHWLMICDNYDNPKVPGNTDPGALDLLRYLPGAHQGSVIVTTRSSEVKLGHCMRVQKLEDLQDGLKILEHSSGRQNLVDDDGAIRLARKLDGLPLALATAGAYLSQSTVTFDEYLDFFELSWARLHKPLSALTTYEDRTLYSTWQVSYERIKQRNSVSANLLRLWAYFDNQDLWYELLRHLCDEDHEWMQELSKDKLNFEDCMRVLCDHGLVEANASNAYGVESKGYGVHACVHSWMRAVLNANNDLELERVALACTASHVPKQSEQQWSLIQRRLLDHANRCVECISEEMCNSPDLAWVYGTFGNLYADQDKLDEAEKMYMRALRGTEQALGADHTSTTLITMNNLGSLYSDQGKRDEAEKMYLRALRGTEQALGADHLSTLDTIKNLGNLYSDRGKLDEAEKMYMRALKGQEKALGADHSSTLNTIYKLGNLYFDQGKLEEAEKMYLRALRGQEKALGADHTWTLDIINNLGNLYSDRGKLDEAEKMYMRALKGQEKALGADHSSTLTTINNLGALYFDEGKLDEAEKMYLRALRGKEKALGADHRSTLSTVDNLGVLCFDQGKLDEAGDMLLRALRGREKALGAGHTSTLITVRNLGEMYHEQGKHAEARKMYQRALEGYTGGEGDHEAKISYLRRQLSLLEADERSSISNHGSAHYDELAGPPKSRETGADHTTRRNETGEISAKGPKRDRLLGWIKKR